MAVGVLFRTLKAYCTEMRPVMFRAASGMSESCRMRSSGSGPAGFEEEEAQAARRTPSNVILSGVKDLKADSFARRRSFGSFAAFTALRMTLRVTSHT